MTVGVCLSPSPLSFSSLLLLLLLLFSFKMIKGNRIIKKGGDIGIHRVINILRGRDAGCGWILTPHKKNSEKIIVSPYYYFYRNKYRGVENPQSTAQPAHPAHHT